MSIRLKKEIKIYNDKVSLQLKNKDNLTNKCLDP